LNTPKTKKQKSLLKILLISFFSLTALVILFFSILLISFLAYKDDISKSILLAVNQKINGKVSFSNISFTPFKHFPNAALKFYDLSLQESKDSVQSSNKPPVFEIDEAYISVNIIDLFSSRINVSAITFEGGILNVIVYPDSITNLDKAINQVKKRELITDKKPVRTDSSYRKTKEVSKPKSDLSLQIDNLELTDVKFNIKNHLTKNILQLQIDELQSDFTYISNKIVSSLNFDTKIDSLIIGDNLLLADKQMSFESDFEVITDSIYVKLEEGRFSIGEANFNFKGFFDSKNEGFVDVAVSVSDNDFSLFSILLKDEEIKNLRAGKLFFDGSIKGKTFVEFPEINVAFGFSNVELVNPVTERTIKNLDLEGYFNSGKKNDFSKARLKIDTLNADFPDGTLKLSGSIKNFLIPEVDFQLYLKADVTGLDEVFKLDFIDDLRGKIEINDRLKGKYLVQENRFSGEINNSKILLENFGFNIPGALKIDRMNGNISREKDEYYFDNLSVISDDTDFLINGKIENLEYLILNIEKEINADLTIKSSIFDLPNFLAFDPSIKRDFPYRILNIDVDVLAKTTTSNVLKFKSFPEIDFDIKKFYATAENFLPPLKIKSGKVKISESILGFNLNCKDFKTDFLGGQFNFTGVYNSSKAEPFYIKLDTKFNGISPSQIIYSKGDTIPEYLSGKLSGSFFTDLQFPEDSSEFKFLNLKDANLLYYLPEDTMEFKSLNLKVADVYFDSRNDENPLSSLYTSGSFRSKKVKSKLFAIDDLDFKFSVVNGAYKLESKMVRLFGKNAKGTSDVTIQPFSDIPTISLNYNIKKFYAEEMLTTFLEDTVITGPLSLSMNLNARGDNLTSLVNSLSGQINLSGEDLLLYGLDADQIIEKFKRSQNFNLVDLGAVVLAGPVGIAVTKGSDLASIFVFNSGERSTINKIVSNWNINNGLYTIEDAAFTTSKNRITTKGMIDFAKDTLDLTIALIDKNGCSIFSQKAYGNLNEPTLGKVKVVGTILAPVTNLMDDIFGADCDVFYTGKVKHPQ